MAQKLTSQTRMAVTGKPNARGTSWAHVTDKCWTPVHKQSTARQKDTEPQDPWRTAQAHDNGARHSQKGNRTRTPGHTAAVLALITAQDTGGL